MLWNMTLHVISTYKTYNVHKNISTQNLNTHQTFIATDNVLCINHLVTHK